MPYQNKELLTDKNNNPIPQIFDPVLGDFVPLLVGETEDNIAQMQSDVDTMLAKVTAIEERLQNKLLSTGEVEVATAGQAVRLPNKPCKQVIISALQANTGNVYIGMSTVSSVVYGAVLEQGDRITLPIDNANEVYIDADNNGDKISYIAT